MHKQLNHLVVVMLALAQISLAARMAGAQQVSSGNELFKLNASDAAPFRIFGSSVSVSGNLALVGSPGAGNDGLSPGSAYLFDVSTGQELLIFTPSDAVQQDQFGSSVAICGDKAIVGAYGSLTDGGGAAYVFDVTTGQELFKLSVDDAQIGDSVAISGNVAIIGSVSDSAYLFDVTTGQQLFKLTASDMIPNNYFGFSVGISGNTAIVGSLNNAAYLFDVTTGQELHKLTSPELALPTTGISLFGQAVAISGDMAIVGAPVSGFGTGAAYLFDALTGQPLAKLTAPEPEAADLFGVSVAIDDHRAIVGGGYAHADGNTRSAFLFDVLTGELIASIERSQIGVNPRSDTFTEAVAISGRNAIVGASEDGIFTGSAYVYSTVPEPAGLVILLIGMPFLTSRKWPRQCRPRHTPALESNWSATRLSATSDKGSVL